MVRCVLETTSCSLAAKYVETYRNGSHWRVLAFGGRPFSNTWLPGMRVRENFKSERIIKPTKKVRVFCRSIHEPVCETIHPEIMKQSVAPSYPPYGRQGEDTFVSEDCRHTRPQRIIISPRLQQHQQHPHHLTTKFQPSGGDFTFILSDTSRRKTHAKQRPWKTQAAHSQKDTPHGGLVTEFFISIFSFHFVKPCAKGLLGSCGWSVMEVLVPERAFAVECFALATG